uniref:Ubiquitin-like domain-containing protein n=1 Tax=Parastrongyloides trichosuri TaxID=131310 RepID=A0A0N4ZQN3_PARTI
MSNQELLQNRVKRAKIVRRSSINNPVTIISSEQGLEFGNDSNTLLDDITLQQKTTAMLKDAGGIIDALHNMDNNKLSLTQINNMIPNFSKNSDSSSHEYSNCYTQIYPAIQPINNLLKQNHFPVPGPVTKSIMAEYLSKKKHVDCIINLRCITVGQKSYGDEKRFLCPPPTIELINLNGWKNLKIEVEKFINEIVLKHGDTVQKGQILTNIALQNDPSKLLGTARSYGIQNVKEMPVEFNENTGLAILKNVYFTHISTIKSTHISAHLYYSCGLDLGQFDTDDIRIISKPSKKKSNAVRNETKHLFIASGLKIALFARIRNQVVHTKFVHFHENNFVSSPSHWGCLEIYIIDEKKTNLDDKENETFSYKDGNLCFGNIVKIIDGKSGLGLPLLRILKPEKTIIDINEELLLEDSNEPVCQLQKVCFQYLYDPIKFISLKSDNVTMSDASKEDDGKLKVAEDCIIQIVSAKEKEETFYCSTGITPFPITPIPTVLHICDCGADSDYRIEISGYNFVPNLIAWVGDEQLLTIFKSGGQLTAIPNKEQYLMFKIFYEQKNMKALVLSISRDDGVIFGTNFTIKPT